MILSIQSMSSAVVHRLVSPSWPTPPRAPGRQGWRARGHLVAGPGVPAPHDPTSYTHYALARSIEHRFGLPLLGNAADPSTRTIPAIAGPRRLT
jgi:hypothetical protein